METFTREKNRCIVHLITEIEPGGAEKQLYELCKQQVLNNEVWVIYIKGQGSLKVDLESIGVKVQRVDFKSLLSIKQQLRFRSIGSRVLQHNVVVHAHLPRAELLGVVFALLLQAKLVVTKHNSEPMWPKAPKFFSRLLSRLVAKRADAIVCISKSVYHFLKGRKELLDGDKVTIVYYGLNLTDQQPILKSSATEGLNLGTLSRLEKQKNLKLLISAVNILRNEGFDVRATVYGAGSLRDQLIDQVRELSITNHVSINEPVKDLSQFWKEIDLFVLTSLYEGFGLATLEAIWQGKPILISASDASREILGDDSVNLFKNDDLNDFVQKVLFLLSDKDALYRNATTAREKANKFSIVEATIKLNSVYDEI